MKKRKKVKDISIADNMRGVVINISLAALFLISAAYFSGCYSTGAAEKREKTDKRNSPAITPKWAFGHIVWEDSINTQEAAMNLVSLYREHQIPVGGVIIDSPWSMSYNDFNWDKNRYPEPDKMINSFRKEDVKVLLWLTGCVNKSSGDVPVQRSPDYDYVIEKGYVVNNGKPSKWWKGEGVHIDFTNPDAVKWWESKLDKVFTKGVYGFKVDQGEYYFADSLSMLNAKKGQDDSYFGDTITTSIGRISLREFKRYYYDAMFDYVRSRKKAGITLARPFSHQGSFAASINKLGLGWSGDFRGDYEGLKLQINNIYTSAKAGYGALACEVGGFYEARSTKKQLIRYAQFGAMTSCMINGGQNGAFTNHLPWYHDDETTGIYRYYVALHYMFSPYMFSTVVDAHLYGGSMLKDVSFEQESHKIGNDIFFKAITSDTGRVTFTLPAGDDWIDFWTDTKYEGGSTVTKEYGLEQAPVFIRSGAIIPLEIDNDITGIGDRSFAGKVVFLIYPDGKGHYIFHKPVDDGIKYNDIDVTCSGSSVSVRSSIEHSFIFLIKSNLIPGKVDGADNWKYDMENKRIKISKTGSRFTIFF